jgi:glycosyltransferase involved in cell wall biosynthesis
VKTFRIALVTAYPPAQGRVSEYGWHLAQTIRASPRVAEVQVLADDVDGAPGRECDGNLTVRRCWTFDRSDFPIRIAQALSDGEFDAVWFNVTLTSTGRRRLPRALALSTPAALRLLGHTTIVTLHHLPDLTDISKTLIRTTSLDRLGAYGVVRMLGHASRICLTLPEYAALMRERYGTRRARFLPLGAPGLPPCPVQRDRHAVLAFGRFGSYKRLEVIIDAAARLHRAGHPIQLHVAGSDSAYSPGYLSSFQRGYAGYPNITFHGYMPECELPSLFGRCAVAVLPYRTTTGVSSVAMQAGMYGTSILAADTPGLRLMDKLGLRMTFADMEDASAFAPVLAAFLAAHPASRAADSSHNLAYCADVAMPRVVDAYLDEIEQISRTRYQGRMTVEMTSSVRS